MTGLKMTFNGLRGWTLEAGETVTGFDASVQCALVHIGTVRGSGIIFPDYGTDLLKSGLLGLITDLASARHLANFAAAETREFINARTDDGSGIVSLFLQPSQLEPPVLHLNTMMVSETQEERGIILDTTTQ